MSPGISLLPAVDRNTLLGEAPAAVLDAVLVGRLGPELNDVENDVVAVNAAQEVITPPMSLVRLGSIVAKH